MSEKIADVLNSLEWFAEYKKFDFKEVTLNSVYLNYVALTEEQKELVGEEDSAGEMLSAAAEFGMSKGRIRFSDDEDDAKYIDVFWKQPKLTVELEVSIKHQFGKLICEASGIIDVFDAKSEAELAEKVKAEAEAKAKQEVRDLEDEAAFNLDGVDVPGSTDMDNLEQTVLDQHAENNVNV